VQAHKIKFDFCNYFVYRKFTIGIVFRFHLRNLMQIWAGKV